VLAISLATHANLFLAAFAAGVTVATTGPDFRHEFEQFGELVSELLKLAAILVFGALITPAFLFEEISLAGWVFAVLALLLARPLRCWYRCGAHPWISGNGPPRCGSGRRGSPPSCTG
jgi:NhaP-type Na+/H+ and K+/H+ antiporter